MTEQDDRLEAMIEVVAALGGAIEQIKALGSTPSENATRALQRGIEVARAAEDIPYLLSEVERGRAVLEAARRLTEAWEPGEFAYDQCRGVAAVEDVVAAVAGLGELPEERSDA